MKKKSKKKPSTLQIAVGDVVRAELDLIDRSANALATAVHVHKGTMSKRLNGMSAIDIDELDAMAQQLRMPVWTIFFAAENGPAKLVEILPPILRFAESQKPKINSAELIFFTLYCLRLYASKPLDPDFLSYPS